MHSSGLDTGCWRSPAASASSSRPGTLLLPGYHSAPPPLVRSNYALGSPLVAAVVSRVVKSPPAWLVYPSYCFPIDRVTYSRSSLRLLSSHTLAHLMCHPTNAPAGNGSADLMIRVEVESSRLDGSSLSKIEHPPGTCMHPEEYDSNLRMMWCTLRLDDQTLCMSAT